MSALSSQAPSQQSRQCLRQTGAVVHKTPTYRHSNSFLTVNIYCLCFITQTHFVFLSYSGKQSAHLRRDSTQFCVPVNTGID